MPERLLAVFDPDPDRAQEKIRDLLFRLRKFFGWSGCAEDLAQETLRRGFTRIRDGVRIDTDPAHYFFGVARNVRYEHWKKSSDASVGLDEIPPARLVDDGHDPDEGILIEQCLAEAPLGEREIMQRYFKEDHPTLAQELGITQGALRVRALRAFRRAKQRLEQRHPDRGSE